MILPVAALLIALILALLLRSLVAPVYLVIAVLLNFAATLGATVYVFQGISGKPGVTFQLPIILYLFVVAIGTDYNILMIARLREEAREGNEPREAAAIGVEHGGPTVAAAGLILAGTFGVADAGADLVPAADGLRGRARHRALGVRDVVLLRARAHRAHRPRRLVARPRRRGASPGGAWSQQASELVEHQRTGHRDVERCPRPTIGISTTVSMHGQCLGRHPVALVAEDHHRSAVGPPAGRPAAPLPRRVPPRRWPIPPPVAAPASRTGRRTRCTHEGCRSVLPRAIASSIQRRRGTTSRRRPRHRSAGACRDWLRTWATRARPPGGPNIDAAAGAAVRAARPRAHPDPAHASAGSVAPFPTDVVMVTIMYTIRSRSVVTLARAPSSGWRPRTRPAPVIVRTFVGPDEMALSAIDLAGRTVWHRPLETPALGPRVGPDGTIWTAPRSVLTSVGADAVSPEREDRERMRAFVVLPDGFLLVWRPVARRPARLARATRTGGTVWSTALAFEELFIRAWWSCPSSGGSRGR